jgi:hypothetical protein
MYHLKLNYGLPLAGNIRCKGILAHYPPKPMLQVVAMSVCRSSQLLCEAPAFQIIMRVSERLAKGRGAHPG